VVERRNGKRKKRELVKTKQPRLIFHLNHILIFENLVLLMYQVLEWVRAGGYGLEG